MFNFLDFIDSLDIREYNKDTVFAPAEQAALIMMSINTTLDQKLNALKELITLYPNEEDFHFEMVGTNMWTFNTDLQYKFRQAVVDNIRLYESVLEECKNPNPNEIVTYALYLHSVADKDYEPDFYETYDDAYNAMKLSIKEDYDDNDLVIARISRIYMIKGEREFQQWDAFDYNKNCDLIRVYPAEFKEKKFIPYGGRLDNLYLNIKYPFKQGDLIKFVYLNGEKEYGVCRYDYDPNRIPIEMENRDWTDMVLYVDQYEEKYHYWRSDDTQVLRAVKATIYELEGVNKILALIQDVYHGYLHFTDFLFMIRDDNIVIANADEYIQRNYNNLK